MAQSAQTRTPSADLDVCDSPHHVSGIKHPPTGQHSSHNLYHKSCLIRSEHSLSDPLNCRLFFHFVSSHAAVTGIVGKQIFKNMLLFLANKMNQNVLFWFAQLDYYLIPANILVIIPAGMPCNCVWCSYLPLGCPSHFTQVY